MEKLMGMTVRVTEKDGSLDIHIATFDPYVCEGPEDSSPAVTIDEKNRRWRRKMDTKSLIHLEFGELIRQEKGEPETYLTVLPLAAGLQLDFMCDELGQQIGLAVKHFVRHAGVLERLQGSSAGSDQLD